VAVGGREAVAVDVPVGLGVFVAVSLAVGVEVGASGVTGVSVGVGGVETVAVGEGVGTARRSLSVMTSSSNSWFLKLVQESRSNRFAKAGEGPWFKANTWNS
jgi:hypothetical protein